MSSNAAAKPHLALNAPMIATGAAGGALRVSALTLDATSAGVNGTLVAQLQGSGLPAVKISFTRFAFADGAFSGDAALSAHFNMAMLHGADIAANGALSWRDGRLTFAPSACLKGALAAFRPGTTDMARAIRGSICAIPGQPLLAIDTQGWRFSGAARGASFFLPLANAQIEKRRRRTGLSWRGRRFFRARHRRVRAGLRPRPAFALSAPGGQRHRGSAKRNLARPFRAHWRPQKIRAGRCRFHPQHGQRRRHRASHRAGHPLFGGQIAARSAFAAAGGPAPAEGSVHFSGDLTWTRSDIKSSGTLSIDSLDF